MEREEGRKEEEEEVAFPIKGAEKGGGGCRDVAGEEAEDRVSQQ